MDERESKFEPTFYPKSKKQEMVQALSKAHMARQLPGEGNKGLREELTPNYPFSCKRIVVSDDYYPTLLRSNVQLETASISAVTGTGIKMSDGSHHDLDCLVLATGFNSTQFLSKMRVFGAEGYDLNKTWGDNGASAYLGITVPSLPNFGMLYGPNTNLAYNSLILQIEAQTLYLMRLISAVLGAKRQGNTLSVEVRTEVTERYNRALQSKLAGSTFADQRCSSWFKDEKGRIINNWAGSAVDYQKRVCELDWRDFEVRGTASQGVITQGVVKWQRTKEEGSLSHIQIAVIMVGFIALGTFGFWMRW